MRSRGSLNQVGDIFSALGQVGHQLLQKFVLLGAQLLNDVREEILDCFGLRLTADDEGVVGD